jgi:predicted O-methyltransferase YrrM
VADVLDDRVLAVMRRLEEEDRLEREQGLPSSVRARAVPATTGRFLFSLVVHHPGCDVLELGGSRGYSTLWLAAGVRYLGGRVVSLENDPAKCEARRLNIAEAGLDEWVELVDGDAFEILPALSEAFDVVFIDAEKEDYERLFQLAREKVEPGAVFVADNVISHQDPLGGYSRARQDDAGLVSVTVPLDRGLELSAVLTRSV